MKKRKPAKKSEAQKGIVVRCSCPYCEEELFATALPYCRHCSVTLRYCVTCQIAVAQNAEVCPQCGGQLVWK